MFSAYVPWWIAAFWISLTALTVLMLRRNDDPVTAGQVLRAAELRP
jgi:hypothetical protein